MIRINDVEILTVGDGLAWSGAKDIVSRTLSFTVLYVPEDKNFPRYEIRAGQKVEWIEDNKTRFIGYVESIDYSTDGESISVNCIDYMVRLLKSKCLGRFYGTLNQLCNNICGAFGLQNGIESDSKHVHNIVSEGDLSYYDILNTACKNMFERYTLYLDGITLKLATDDIIETYEIGRNIRTSNFSQDMSSIVTKVLIIDNDGNLINTVEDTDGLKNYGLYQEVYNYNKDAKDNLAEAKNLLKTIENKASLIVDNNNDCISGRLIRVIEPINNFNGIFEIQTDDHTIGDDSSLSMEIKFVRAE